MKRELEIGPILAYGVAHDLVRHCQVRISSCARLYLKTAIYGNFASMARCLQTYGWGTTLTMKVNSLSAAVAVTCQHPSLGKIRPVAWNRVG